MNRLKEADLGPDTRRRQHTDRTGQHRRFIAQNVSEHVVAQQHVELSRVPHQLHRGIIHVDMSQFDIRIGRMDIDHHLAPQARTTPIHSPYRPR